MQHVDQWYRYLTEAEKTATMYTLLQHSTQVQARFFINLLQQMVKRDPLFSLLTPNNPDQGKSSNSMSCKTKIFTHTQLLDMQNHLAGAMAKAELEASQRLMSVLPYKTGQVISRPPSNTNRRTVDRHSFALGDTEEYSRLFSSGGRSNSNDFLNPSYAAAAGAGGRSSSPYVNSLLDDNSTNARRLANSNRNSGTSGRTMFNNGGRPHSVIEGDTSLLFPTSSNSSNWLNANNSNSNARRVISPGHIGDRPSSKLIERPKSADISNWSLPTEPMDRRSTGNNGFSSVWNNTQQQATIPEFVVDNDLIDFTNSFNQQSFRNSASRRSVNRIPAVVPESADELIKSTQDLFLDNNYARSNNSKQHANAPPGMEHYSNYLLTQQQPQPSLQSIVDNSNNHLYVSSASNSHNNNHENGYLSDHSDESYMSRRRSSSMVPSAANNSNQTRASKDKKAVEVIDMELLKGKERKFLILIRIDH